MIAIIPFQFRKFLRFLTAKLMKLDGKKYITLHVGDFRTSMELYTSPKISNRDVFYDFPIGRRYITHHHQVWRGVFYY